MSLLPPSLSSPAPAQTGNASSASSASSASCAASNRGDESSQGDAPSFGDVLSRSLAASGESSAKTAGKPAASVPVKRAADEKKTDATDPVNTAALLFIPLESRIARTADGSTAAAAGGATAPAAAAAPLANQAADPATPAATEAAAAANDAGFAVDAEVQAQAPQALLASGLPVTSAKDRGPAATPAALAPAGDEAALALPAGNIAAPAGASADGKAGQFAARDDRPGDTAQKPGDTDKSVERPHVTAKTAAMAAANDPADKTAGSSTSVSAPAAAGHRPDAEVPATGPSPTIGTASAAVHANAAPASPAAPAVTSQAALTPEVGTGEWGKALGQQMVHMGKAGEHVAELQLNPPGLGPLKVTLSMNDNQVQALFVSAHSSVRAAVEAALPQLRNTLADSGISLGNTSVNSGSQQQQAGFAQNPGGQSAQRGQQGYLPADASPLAPTAVAPAPRRGNAMGVDTYA
jgi:flagellar hook-length control protein FliK